MAVDRSKFRTCDNTSFCRRNRDGRNKLAYQYNLDPLSIQYHPHPNNQHSSNVETDEQNEQQQKQQEQDQQQEEPRKRGYIQSLKQMLSKSSSNQNENSNKIDPHFLGPNPFFTANLINTSPFVGKTNLNPQSKEQLNLSIHLHDNGIARIRITEEYQSTNTNSDSRKDKDKKAYAQARWTSDELILNTDEMKYASDVQVLDDSNDEGRMMLQKLTSTLKNGSLILDNNDSDELKNLVLLKFGDMNMYDDYTKEEDQECASRSSLLLIQYQSFSLHLWREICTSSINNKKDDDDVSYGLPMVSMNSDSLMHFEIRRNKEDEQKLNDNHDISNESEQQEGNDAVDTNLQEEEEEEEDRHGGKEIVGYWEDGLAIYADGTREEKKEFDLEDLSSNSILQKERKRRILMDVQEGIDENFQFDTDDMWEEKFGDHLDTKPYGPMSVGADISFPASTHLFGLPEHASSTQLKRTTGNNGAHYQEPYRLYNLDVFEYELDETMALYGEVPLIISQSKSSGTVGVFWFNPTETFVDVDSTNEGKGSTTHWISESGIIDLFFIPGPNPKALYQQYATITGRMPLPPMWTLGYHQCRWNYRDEEDVYQVHNKFEELDYPYDVLWLDIEHTDGKRYFTWDKHLFPNPIPMQEKLKSQGRNMVTIIDPHIKRDNHYYIHKEATSKGLYIKDKTGEKDYDGWCWPGSSSYLDFTSEEVRNWWADQFAYNKYIGSSPSLFTWNDMNEPSVFNGPEVSMQKDLRNLNGVEHREWHNLYGVLFQRATAEGLTHRNPDGNIRPFVLSRSFYAGSQRYGSIWTGDNESSWPHLKIAAPMLLSLNTAALSFVGADVGGFFGNPDAELMTRWMQAGAYQPFFRGHAHHDAKRREPWMFGDEWMVRMRRAAMARYALLPYWYTVFKEAGVTGMPVMRTMWMQYPDVEELYGIDDQYLIGSDMLVKPVTEAGATQTQVVFPTEHDWYDVDTIMKIPLNNDFVIDRITVQSDIDKIPVYQRGGSIIARKLRLRRSTQLMTKDPYTLYIALDKSSTYATGVLYMDDEISFDHERKGHFGEAIFSVDMKTSITNRVNADSQWITDETINAREIERIIIMGVEKSPQKLLLGGIPLSFNYDSKSKKLAIRKPNVAASSDWEILVVS